MATILIVDALGATHSTVDRVLSEVGYAIQHVTQPDEALTSITSTSPHLILLRAALPGGLEVLRQLRASKATAGIPIAFLAADSAAWRYRLRVFEAGADDFLRERMSRADLRARVRLLLRDRMTRSERFRSDSQMHLLLDLVRTASLDLSMLAGRLLNWAFETTSLAAGSLWILRQDQLVCLAGAGMSVEQDMRLQVKESDLFRRALATSMPIHGSLADQPHPPALANLHWAVAVPLIAHGNPIGVLLLGTVEIWQPSEDELNRILAALARAPIIALMLQNAWLFEEIEHQQRLLNDLESKKDEFLWLVSHELNNPLAAIKGYTDLLRRRAQRLPDLAEHFKGIEMIDQQIGRMGSLLSMLLDASRLAMGRFAVEPRLGDLLGVVESVVGVQQETTTRHQILLHSGEPVIECEFDPVRIAQVVSYLLNNGIKFSPQGGVIRVVLQREGDQIVLSVSDEGIGIPAEEIDSIFERFGRASNAVSSFSGLGLGLYIAREIIERHGGTIEVSSQQDHGSIFMVRLPATIPGSLKESLEQTAPGQLP